MKRGASKPRGDMPCGIRRRPAKHPVSQRHEGTQGHSAGGASEQCLGKRRAHARKVRCAHGVSQLKPGGEPSRRRSARSFTVRIPATRSPFTR